MPTNQSSPWDGGKLRDHSNTDGLTPVSVRTHPKTVATTKVPISQTSQELSRRNDQAKTVSSHVAQSASPVGQTTGATFVLSLSENGDGDRTNAQSQFTTVPERSATLPLQFNETQSPNQSHETGQKQVCISLIETSVSSSLPGKECRLHPPGNSDAVSQAATADKPLEKEPLLAVSHPDLFIQGKYSLQQTNKMMLVRSSSPSVPRLCLTLSDHQGAAFRKDASSLYATKAGIRNSTKRRSNSAKPATKCSQAQNRRITALNNLLEVVGFPPPVMATSSNNKRQIKASQDVNKQAPESRCPAGRTASVSSPLPKGAVPTVLSASAAPEEPTAPMDAVPGALMGSVTAKISAIHLTKQEQPDCVPSSSPSSPSPLECQGGDDQLSGSESVVQADGGEEEQPDEPGSAGSDDDDSDCLSIDGISSSSSLALLSGIEEPMSLEAEDNREERPALVPSLFPFFPPTLYFSTANEKVELLPAEQRRLLKWKLSTVTPNIVKNTIGRSHFKVTKKSHDWLGCWGHHMKSPGFKALGEHQKLNHFPGTFQIGRKDRLWRNLSKMQVRFGKQEFNFFPRTFVLPQDTKLLRKAWEDGSSRQKWIIKPPASARGLGIQVIHRWSQLPRKRPILVQKYLHKPYLISGNKFDLRIYVYVSSYNPLRIYIFSDGLVRFASCKYSSSMKTLSNKFMHLTNYSINKKNSEYQANSDDKACQGHKWALKALWQYLGSKGVNTTLIWEKIKDIVIKTIIASEPYVNTLLKMNVRTPYSCHELFGFDIMLDENLKPWILEVNISPSLHSNTALDVSIKGQMMRDLLNLAGFQIPQKEDVVAPCSSSSASSSTSSLCSVNRERSKPDISADEKLKRAFYLTQRDAEQDFLSTVLDVLTPDDVRVLAESEDELTRRGEFDRIFPAPSSSRYLRFFESPRYLNMLLDQWEQKYWSNRTKGISLLRPLCQEGVHLGTNNPAHMWSNMWSNFEPHRQELVSPSRSRVVVTHQRRSDHTDEDEGSDSSLPASHIPGSSVTSSACASPPSSL